MTISCAEAFSTSEPRYLRPLALDFGDELDMLSEIIHAMSRSLVNLTLTNIVSSYKLFSFLAMGSSSPLLHPKWPHLQEVRVEYQSKLRGTAYLNAPEPNRRKLYEDGIRQFELVEYHGSLGFSSRVREGHERRIGISLPDLAIGSFFLKQIGLAMMDMPQLRYMYLPRFESVASILEIVSFLSSTTALLVV